MKRIYYSIIVLLFGLNAFAQTSDTGRIDTSKRALILNGNQESKPLILVDGTIYKGNINELSPDNISEIHVVRDASYAKIYGKAGANGVIIITTKGHTSIYKPLSPVTDTVNHSHLPDNAMYVIDGAMSEKKLDGIDPNDILSIQVLKDKAAEPMEGSNGSATIIVITKPGAINGYKKKFSEFSSKYKEYLESHSGDDSGLLYSIDGYNCDTGLDGLTRLYQLSKGKIAKLKLSKTETGTEVVITTKK